MERDAAFGFRRRTKARHHSVLRAGDYGGLDPANLQKVKDRAAALHISIDSGMGCICETSKSFNKKGPPARDQLLAGLRVAKTVGARAMRCYMGSSEDRLGPLPIEALMETTIKLFRSVKSEATDLGVKIAIENHSGDMQARETRTVIEDRARTSSAPAWIPAIRSGPSRIPSSRSRSWRPTRSHARARFHRVRDAARRRRTMGSDG